jgi:hypothetical protein
MRERKRMCMCGVHELTSSAVSSDMCEQIAGIRRKLQRISKDKILFLDETHLRLNAAPTHTLVLPNEQPYVIATDTSAYAARYDMIACVSGETTLLPKIYTPKERSDAGVKGINGPMLQQFIDDTLAQAVEGLDRYPLALILDRAPIHKNTEQILQSFHDRSSESIKEILLMPPNAAKRMSPLDNSLFHDWKDLCRKHSPLTKSNIEQVMADSWNQIAKETIHAYYKHCGLMRGQDPYFDCPDPVGHAHDS